MNKLDLPPFKELFPWWGGDLQTIGAAAASDTITPVVSELLLHYHAFITSLRQMPKIVLASVHGSAAGAGLSLRRETLGLANLTAQPLGVEVTLDTTLAAREARHFFFACESQFGQSRTRPDLQPRKQPPHRPLHRGRADQKGFLTAALVEEPVSKDVASVQIGGELNFIHRHEIKIEVARHRLHCRDVIARPFWLDLFLSGNEGDGLGASFLDHAIEDLARKQSKRQSDHAGLMR